MEKCIMKLENQVESILKDKFEAKRVTSVVQYFISSTQKFEQGDWDSSLSKSGKFIEAVIKMLWVYAGKSLPTKQKDFKAGVFAQKIINGEIGSSEIPEDGVRLEIPRASIFIYDITSNRGARHDSDEITPNEMDSSTILPLCSWILAELVRFSAKKIDIDDAKKIIHSLIERKYPIFEEIDDRIYVDHKKFKSANECALLLLYGSYPNRIAKDKFIACLKLHKFKQSAIKLERLTDYIDIDKNDNILLRATGRRKAEEILNK
jgi:hypothetical protein